MKSNLSRWGLSRYYITKEGILYFKTLNKGWVKKPFRLLESKKRKKYTQSLLNDEGKYVYYKGLNIRDIQLRLRLKSSTSIRRILKNRSLLD